jgi:hypothetical protein
MPADKLNLTKAATAFEGTALYPQMSILMGVIKGDDYMASYLKKPDLVMTAFPAVNAVSRCLNRPLGCSKRGAGRGERGRGGARRVRGLWVPNCRRGRGQPGPGNAWVQ